MSQRRLSVREIQNSDIALVADYWLQADTAYLEAMGVEVSKMPARPEWETMLTEQIRAPLAEKKSYCLIWLLEDQPVGHSNVNKIIFGEEAYMHLHLWHADVRKLGYGAAFINLSLPYFFRNLQLQTLYCEPYALNPAPNKTLEKAGFSFVKSYTTTPGWINFEQPVNLWKLSAGKYKELQKPQEQV
ncbi:GNAT family N-acetyltransferase [Pontibacter chitinilyticus]|uniref:GNAT family N-acetyltransferase n=1 Tax=Pontibacter chitinilyticus TaxID=2674989 RepID=UPI00321ADCF4